MSFVENSTPEFLLFQSWADQYLPILPNPDRRTWDRNDVFLNWLDNHRYIQKRNQENNSFQLGHNQFSGMNTSEFKTWVHTIIPSFSYLNNTTFDEPKEIKESMDWRELGAVTPVKDQQNCGSCYAFSTTGGLEGAYQIKTGNLVSFSEQQILDCGNRKSGHGCNGGDMGGSYDWIHTNGGLCEEQEYAYFSGETGKAGDCSSDKCSLVAGSKVAETVYVQPNSDSAMMAALQMQPVSVAIEADQRDFQLYKSGVFTGSCGTSLDHGVLLVGYGSFNTGSTTGSKDSADYYIMKNSWGQSWGDNGYCYLGRGDQYNGGKGQCGVLMQGVYPRV
jgi:C1A family cysteine protease